jgi:hypothetical protein
MIQIIPTCDIRRLEENETSGTFGVLLICSQVFCCTLEPPDRLNQRSQSAIPAQQYTCRRHHSPRFGRTFKVENVPGRTDILFHPGNTADHTSGCILLGRSFGNLSGRRAILNSGQTFTDFMTIMENVEEFKLTIHQTWG